MQLLVNMYSMQSSSGNKYSECLTEYFGGKI